VPKGNRELLELGAAPLGGGELETTGNLSERLRGHAQRRPVERDLLGCWLLRNPREAVGIPRGKYTTQATALWLAYFAAARSSLR
jgi:hypothetical protein